MKEKTDKCDKYIIDKPFQFRYVGLILGVFLITVVSVGIATFCIVWNNVVEALAFGEKCPEVNIALGGIVAKTALLLIGPILLLMGIFVIVGIIFSRKIAGPLHTTQKATENISKGRLRVSLKFEKNDKMDNLANAFNTMIKGLRTIVTADKKSAKKMITAISSLKSEVKKSKHVTKNVKAAAEQLGQIASELKKNMNKFKL